MRDISDYSETVQIENILILANDRTAQLLGYYLQMMFGVRSQVHIIASRFDEHYFEYFKNNSHLLEQPVLTHEYNSTDLQEYVNNYKFDIVVRCGGEHLIFNSTQLVEPKYINIYSCTY